MFLLLQEDGQGGGAQGNNEREMEPPINGNLIYRTDQLVIQEGRIIYWSPRTSYPSFSLGGWLPGKTIKCTTA